MSRLQSQTKASELNAPPTRNEDRIRWAHELLSYSPILSALATASTQDFTISRGTVQVPRGFGYNHGGPPHHATPLRCYGSLDP
ncbi:hypothetical protein NMY22_g12462 [Coprinellus aureogranulatus]|nr:hypothetical protein NMY22_g12462 [Coprinellus aureogranulatus]